MATVQQVEEKLKQVFDPEIPVNVFDLGLIYKIDVNDDEGRVDIRMTFTSQECPEARVIPDDVRRKVCSLPDISRTDIEVVWTPEWHPRMISDEGKSLLGIDEDA